MPSNLKSFIIEAQPIVAPRKRVRVSPGNIFEGYLLKIKKPSFLIDEEIKYCLISASAESAEKIVNKNVSFTKNKGLFLNIDNLYEIL